MSGMEPTVPLPVIGVVRTGHREKESTPIQSSLNRAEHGTVEIAAEYLDGLDGLAGFDYAWLLTWLHRGDEAGPAPLRQVPFLLRRQQRKVGIFATRGPTPRTYVTGVSSRMEGSVDTLSMLHPPGTRLPIRRSA